MTPPPDAGVERLRAALADRYRIDDAIGAGGMAVVYRAHDLKHHRDVAIKVLRPELAAVIGAERFLAEIEVTAQLQHPHILPLFDSGQADSFLYYVMPYVEGESLADRLQRERQLPLDEAVRIGAEAADALDYAHRRGVVHRDVKPANLLLHDGRVLVADFGIALAVRQAGAERMTETGLSLGTPWYMSPEQATAERDADARSDVYSLGAVVYEMLAGRPPHAGTSLQGVIAAVLTKTPPPVNEDRAAISPALAAVVHKSIERLPADRFQSAGDFAEALRNPAAFAPAAGIAGAGAGGPGGAVVGAGGGPGRGERALWIALAAAGLGLGAWGWWGRGGDASEAPPAVRFTVEIPDAAMAQVVAASGRVALSPDGSILYYVAPAVDGGEPRLFTRPLDALEATPLATDRGVTDPAASPDGQALAVMEVPTTADIGGALLVVDRARGTATPLASAQAMTGPPSWGGDGWIYGTVSGGGIGRIRPTGGAVDTLYRVPPEEVDLGGTPGYSLPLPGGRYLLNQAIGGGAAGLGTNAIWVLDLETGERRDLLPSASAPHLLPFGVLVYQTPDGGLAGVRFDPETATVIGDPRPLLEGLDWNQDQGRSYDVSTNGVLAYEASTADRTEVVWVDREGAERPVGADLPAQIRDVAVSPDGQRLALTAGSQSRSDLWIYDLEQRTTTRLTTVEAQNWRPAWTPDGDVSFITDRDTIRAVYRRPIDGSAPARLVVRTDRLVQQATWSADGALLYREGYTDGVTGRDLFYRLPGDTVNRPWLATDLDEHSPDFSPDGRWVAYVSEESGEQRIYVRPFPGPGGRVPVSSRAARGPRWGPDGRTIYYRTLTDSLVAAAMDFGSGAPRVASRRALFSTSRYLEDGVDRVFDVHPDGERFLFVREPATARIVVITNWFDEVRAAFGIGG